MVQFRSFTSGAAPSVPKINPLVEALLRRALSERPIKHPLQGFDRLGKAALAAFLKNEDKEAVEVKQAGITKTFQEALVAGQSTPEQAILPSLADVTPGTELDPGGGFRVPGARGDKQALIDVLLGNPDTARFGAELGFNDLFKDPQERFEPVTDAQGNIIGQRSSTTGQVSSDPRTRKSKLLTAEEEEQKLRIVEAGRASGVTPAQSANNAETSAARARLLALRLQVQPGESLRDLIQRQTQRADFTGLTNPDFNETLASDLRLASQRMVGDDPGFGEFFDALDVRVPVPQPEAAPEPEPEGPGFLSRTFDSLFGGDDAAAGLPAAESLPESLSAPATRSRGGRFPSRSVGRSGIDTLATSGTGVQAQPRARGRRGPRPAAAARSISRMSIRELTDLLDERGKALSPAERQEVDARLRALGL